MLRNYILLIIIHGLRCDYTYGFSSFSSLVIDYFCNLILLFLAYFLLKLLHSMFVDLLLAKKFDIVYGSNNKQE